MYGRSYPIFNYVANQMSTADLVHTWIACITWDQFRIADSGAKHAATQGERHRFKGDRTDWFRFGALVPGGALFGTSVCRPG